VDTPTYVTSCTAHAQVLNEEKPRLTVTLCQHIQLPCLSECFQIPYVTRSIRNWLLRYELHKEGSPIPQLKEPPVFYEASNVSVDEPPLVATLGEVLSQATSQNTFDLSGYYIYHQFNIQQFYVQPTQCIYVFYVDLGTNSDHFPIQH
jgi:hypothetical protein